MENTAANTPTIIRQQIIDLIETLPSERLQSVYDYVLFLETRPRPTSEEQRYREIEELVSEVEQLREATAEYHVGIEEGQPTVVRNHFGLSIGGTRLTLYHIMDYVQGGWPPELIQRWFNFTDQQIDDIMDYIESHREEVEAEYQQILEEAERERAYWTEKNKDRFAEHEKRVAEAQGPLWDKLRAWKARLESE